MFIENKVENLTIILTCAPQCLPAVAGSANQRRAQSFYDPPHGGHAPVPASATVFGYVCNIEVLL